MESIYLEVINLVVVIVVFRSVEDREERAWGIGGDVLHGWAPYRIF